MNTDELRRIATAVRGIRAEWIEPAILNSLSKLAKQHPGATAEQLKDAARLAASVPTNRTPASIEFQIIAGRRNDEFAGAPLDPTECVHGTFTRRCALCRRDEWDQPGHKDLNDRLNEQGRISGRIGRPPHRRPKEIEL